MRKNSHEKENYGNQNEILTQFQSVFSPARIFLPVHVQGDCQVS